MIRIIHYHHRSVLQDHDEKEIHKHIHEYTLVFRDQITFVCPLSKDKGLVAVAGKAVDQIYITCQR